MADSEPGEKSEFLLVGLWFLLSLSACILLIISAWFIVWRCVLEKIPTIQEFFGNTSTDTKDNHTVSGSNLKTANTKTVPGTSRTKTD
mmetsp:Transcript_13775/g.15702  ORF Transcript_13775/g.15702 Transcript_13775/m.15702 type:complete len:88 (-) Transcript_13775:301-564(-)